MKKHIPNIITLLNLFSGFIAITLTINHRFHDAIFMLGIAVLCDFCDGLIAKLLHVKSELGKQLDSLADLVSFGLAPSIIIYTNWINEASVPNLYILILCGIFPCMGAFRLGKFNLDIRQSENFLGLPIPLAAFALISIVFFKYNSLFIKDVVYSAVIIMLSALMISEIPLFSLKFKNFYLKENLHRYILILLSIFLFILIRMKSIPFIVIAYFIISIIINRSKS